MSSLFGLLDTMSGALDAQQTGLNVTGQNVANVNTPGYVQRTADLESLAVMPGTNGGVTVSGIQRSFDTFTYGQVLQQQGLSSAADSRSEALSAAQSILAPQGGGDIGSALTAFFSSVTALSASPSDPSARSAVLAQATQLSQTIATTSSGLAQQQQAMLTQARGDATDVNTDLQQIAQLNSQIQQAQALGDQAPDLRDKRDTLANDVATQMGASVVEDPSGSITLFAGGVAMVTGDSAAQLSVSQAPSGAMTFLVRQGNGPPVDITAGVTQGALGGLREARDTDVATSMSQLDQFAYDFSIAVNTIQESGYGLDGVSGRPLFTPPTQVAGAAAQMSVDSSVAGNPNAIAASSSAADLPGGNDVANELAALADEPVGGADSPADAFASIQSQLGSAASSASTDAATRADTLTQAQNLNSSASGVNLDDQTVIMSQFQQAFQASAQVIQVTESLMNDVMQIIPSG
jgi:flagellar hook-associated protein 1